MIDKDLNFGYDETEKFLKSLRAANGISLTQGVLFAVFESIDSFSSGDKGTKIFVKGCLKQYQEGKETNV